MSDVEFFHDEHDLVRKLEDGLKRQEQSKVYKLKVRESTFEHLSYLNHLEYYRGCLREAISVAPSLGNHISFFDEIDSTQIFIENNYNLMEQLPSGFICHAAHQLKGKGRQSTKWKSSKGCLQLSFIWRHPDTLIQKKVKNPSSIMLYQYYAALAMVHAIRSEPGQGSLPVYLKWPNDIYYISKEGVHLKLGGVLVQSHSSGTNRDPLVIIGIGMNLDNLNPTYCLNEIIRKCNAQNGTHIPLWTSERLLAKLLVTFEFLVHLFTLSDGGFTYFIDLYEKYWIHSCQIVNVLNPETSKKCNVMINGVNRQGFLIASLYQPQGLVRRIFNWIFPKETPQFYLHPSESSFDLEEGYIRPK